MLLLLRKVLPLFSTVVVITLFSTVVVVILFGAVVIITLVGAVVVILARDVSNSCRFIVITLGSVITLVGVVVIGVTLIPPSVW